MKTRKLVTIACLLSLAVVVSIVESFIPSFVPGTKIGLANIVTLVIFYLYSSKEAALVHFLRIVLVGLIFSGLFSQAFLLSLAGGVLSFTLMWLCFISKKCSITTMSVIGSVGHSIGQLFLASLLLMTTELIFYLPIMLAIAIPCGILTSLIAKLVLKAFKLKTSKTKLVGWIEFSALFLISITSFVLLSIDYKKEDEGSVAYITYQNELIIKIPLDNPDQYEMENNYNEVEVRAENNSYYFTFHFLNKDENTINLFVVEVKDSSIGIVQETSKKHICMHMGFISSKYQSLICVPNQAIITIEDYKLSELDAKM